MLCWLTIFCSSEEPTATNAWVQFRVITSFKLLEQKGFYSANVPEVTQKLAPTQNKSRKQGCKPLFVQKNHF